MTTPRTTAAIRTRFSSWAIPPGCQLAALVCTDDLYLKVENLSFSVIKGCVPVDGDTYELPMRIATVHKSGNTKLAERDAQRFGDEQRQKELSSISRTRNTSIPSPGTIRRTCSARHDDGPRSGGWMTVSRRSCEDIHRELYLLALVCVNLGS